MVVIADSLGMSFANGVQALDDVCFQLQQGEFVSILGPSGCGKSTLLRLVAGLLESQGNLQIAGQSPILARRSHYPLTFVFQDANLLPWRTAIDNVCLPLELQRVSKEEQYERSLAALDLVDLGDFTDSYPRQLSGGMKMRVSLARALVTRPKLMLLDEPFAALDEITRQKLQNELLAIWHREQWTALFVTHHVIEAVFLSSRILVMSERPGRIVADLVVPFPYPRSLQLRTSVDFAQFSSEVASLLSGDDS